VQIYFYTLEMYYVWALAATPHQRSTRKLTGRFSLKYPCSPEPTGFCERCTMNNFRRNSAQIRASQKECYGQKNRSAQ
jgi:hypothetical protein